MTKWRGTWVLIGILSTYCVASTAFGWFFDALAFALLCAGMVCLVTVPRIVHLAKLESKKDAP